MRKSKLFFLSAAVIICTIAWKPEQVKLPCPLENGAFESFAMIDSSEIVVTRNPMKGGFIKTTDDKRRVRSGSVGVVKQVIDNPNGKKSLTIESSAYFMHYSNLKSLSVVVGDSVNPDTWFGLLEEGDSLVVNAFSANDRKELNPGSLFSCTCRSR